MTTFTKDRQRKAAPVFAAYHERLVQTRKFARRRFENELCDELGMGLKDLRGMMPALVKYPEFQTVAVHYMQNDGNAIKSEFKLAISEAYGVSKSSDFEQAKQKYWEEVFSDAA